MSDAITTCSLCGHEYRAEGHEGCPACPLQPDCTIICCPVCGFSDVDPSQSRAARWMSAKVFMKKSGDRQPVPHETPLISVADLSPGMEAFIVRLQGIEENRREQLMAYGLAPGRCIHVLQQRPVTILMIDHTELAIEEHVAKGIIVHLPQPSQEQDAGRGKRRRWRRRGRRDFWKRKKRRGRD